MSLFRLLRRDRRPAAPANEEFTLTLDGTAHPVTLKRTTRARRFTLRVKPGTGEIMLTVPSWARLSDARAFAERHTGWVSGRLESAADRRPFAPGGAVPIRGMPHVIVHRPGLRGVVWVETAADGRAELHVAGEAEHVERRIVDWLKVEARRDLVTAVAKYTARLGMQARRVAVRDQTTRWGSCSASGALSFSWRLILAPPFVLDYLAAHEVAHLREMNHSPRFWRIVRELCPDTDRAKQWMQTNGGSLHACGPAAGKRPAHDAA